MSPALASPADQIRQTQTTDRLNITCSRVPFAKADSTVRSKTDYAVPSWVRTRRSIYANDRRGSAVVLR